MLLEVLSRKILAIHVWDGSSKPAALQNAITHDHAVWPRLREHERAMMRSQRGPLASTDSTLPFRHSSSSATASSGGSLRHWVPSRIVRKTAGSVVHRGWQRADAPVGSRAKGHRSASAEGQTRPTSRRTAEMWTTVFELLPRMTC